MASAARRLYGTDETVAPARTVRAGPLSLELQHGRLRHIRCAGHEVWHGLAFVMRDPDWGTPEPEIDRVDVQASADEFEVSLEGRFVTAATVAFRVRISGDATGTICFDADAVPDADLMVNRLGLCLMHPLSVCGARVEVTHTDGRTSLSTFPTLIPPWPPFMLVRALRHEWAPGRWARATLEGDLFETEDQRNNGDASFKTYSRSNMAPRPYRLGAGVPLRQSARLHLEPPAVAAPRRDPPLRIAVGADTGDWTPVGIEIRADEADTPALRSALRALRPDHLHLAWRPGIAVAWRDLASLMHAAGAQLRLDALLPTHGDADAALRVLGAELDAAGIAAESIAVFPSDVAHLEAARRALAPLRRADCGSGRRGSAAPGSPQHLAPRRQAASLLDPARRIAGAAAHGAPR